MKKAILLVLGLAVAGILVAPVFLPKQLQLEVKHELIASPSELYAALSNAQTFTEWYFEPGADSSTFQFFSPYTGEGAEFEPMDSSKALPVSGKIVSAKQDSLVSLVLIDKRNNGVDSIHLVIDDLSAGRLRLKVNAKGGNIGYFSRFFASGKKSAAEAEWNIRLGRLEQLIIAKRNAKNEEKKSTTVLNTVVYDKFPGMKLLVIRNQTTTDSIEVETAIAESAGMVRSFLVDAKKIPAHDIVGPVVYYPYWDEQSGEQEFFVGYGIKESLEYPEEFELKALPAGSTAKMLVVGNLTDQKDNILKIRNELEKAKISAAEQLWLIQSQVNGEQQVGIYLPALP